MTVQILKPSSMWVMRLYIPIQGRVLLKVVSPHVDVNVDVDVTYDFFAFY